jgi:hypothetical protein
MRYPAHGAFVGLIVTLSYSIGMIPQALVPFALYTALGVLYGLFIELFATKLCKAPAI